MPPRILKVPFWPFHDSLQRMAPWEWSCRKVLALSSQKGRSQYSLFWIMCLPISRRSFVLFYLTCRCFDYSTGIYNIFHCSLSHVRACVRACVCVCVCGHFSWWVAHVVIHICSSQSRCLSSGRQGRPCRILKQLCMRTCVDFAC